MCGIVGVISKTDYGFSLKEQKIFEQLLFVDSLRGEDSTGIFVVNNTSEVQIAKDVMDSYTFAYTKEYKDIIEYMYRTGKVACGHNRKQTVGKNIDTNAHPFVVNEEFVFVHNGTLHQHRDLAPTEVDSEALAIHLHKALGTDKEDALDEALSKVYGAYACVFYDQRSDTVYLLRNKERPLYLIKEKTKGSYIFSSELGLAAAICSRNDTPIEEHFLLEEGHVYSFDLSKPILKPHVRKLKERSSFFPVTTYQGASSLVNYYPGTGQTRHSTNTTVVESLSKSAFKRFQKQYLNRKVAFFVDDYSERTPGVDANDFPGKPIDWIIFGQLESDPRHKEVVFPNMVQSIVSDKRMDEIIDMYNGIMYGVVSSMEYDVGTKKAIITVTQPTLPEDIHVPATSLQ